MTTLDLINLTKRYSPGVAAVNDLTLAVHRGELLALLGPSGGGKTTILRMIAGLLTPTSGDLKFNGNSILGTPVEKRGAVMVFQEHSLFPFMSVYENVAYGLKLRGLDRNEIRRQVGQALGAVQLSGFETRQPDGLSGGQRQRVALARALVVRPNVLLLDEPLSNLEPALRDELREMIRSLQKTYGITTLYVTHDQVEAVAVADRIALLIDGRLRQIGLPRDFYERPADADVALFFGGKNIFQGTKKGQQVKTDLGLLEVAETGWPDGRVLLTIRPEAIQLGANGYNNLQANVRSYSYRGSVASCEADVNGVELEVAAPPYHRYRVGETVTLHIPRERISLLPFREGV